MMRKLIGIFSVMLTMVINVHSMDITDQEMCRECLKQKSIFNTLVNKVASYDFTKLILPLLIKNPVKTRSIDIIVRNSDVIPMYHKKFSFLILQDKFLDRRYYDNMPVSIIELALQIIK